MRRIVLTSLVPGMLAASVVVAQQRDPATYAKTLERAERVARLQVSRVIETLNIQTGMHVVDLGAGSGLFTRPIARAVGPGGVVYAVEVDEGLLAIIAQSASEEGLGNVRSVLATPDDPKVPGKADLILVCDTLHHIANPDKYVHALRPVVKPGGRVAVIDYRDAWPEGHESMRYSEAQLDAWMRDAGFQRLEAHDFLDGLFFIIYR